MYEGVAFSPALQGLEVEHPEPRPVIHVFAASNLGSEVTLNVFKVLDVSDLCWVPHWTTVFELTSN